MDRYALQCNAAIEQKKHLFVCGSHWNDAWSHRPRQCRQSVRGAMQAGFPGNNRERDVGLARADTIAPSKAPT